MMVWLYRPERVGAIWGQLAVHHRVSFWWDLQPCCLATYAGQHVTHSAWMPWLSLEQLMRAGNH